MNSIGIYPLTLEGERIFLRPLETSDLENWKPFFDDENSLKFLSLDFELDTHTQAERWITRQLNRYKAGEFGLLGIIDKKTGTMVGQAGLLLQYVNGKQELEIGYHLIPYFRKNGYATEAGIILKEFAKLQLGKTNIICLIHSENKPSAAVAARLGMTWEQRTTFRDLTVDIFRTHY